jgi:hypothetical protein
MSIQWESREMIFSIVEKNIVPTHIVLDIGAGIRPQSFFIPTTHIIVEPFLPYINSLKKEWMAIPRTVYLNGTWDRVLPFFPDKSVDTVFALDVIEHFEKEDGIRFIKEVERIASKQIVIFTPLGLYPQEYDESDLTDRWGLQGGYWQSHRSGWEPSEFSDSWDVFACKDFHTVDQHGSPMDRPFGAFWAIKSFSLQPVSPSERLFISELRMVDLIKYGFLSLKSKAQRKISYILSGQEKQPERFKS